MLPSVSATQRDVRIDHLGLNLGGVLFVRMVRGDFEKTNKLKQIVTDTSIGNADQLKRTSALM